MLCIIVRQVALVASSRDGTTKLANAKRSLRILSIQSFIHTAGSLDSARWLLAFGLDGVKWIDVLRDRGKLLVESASFVGRDHLALAYFLDEFRIEPDAQRVYRRPVETVANQVSITVLVHQAM